MRITDSSIDLYVGLNDTGGVVEVFADAEAAWNTETHDESIVSVGFVTAMPTDYDELFNTDEGETDDAILPGLTITGFDA